MRERNVFCIYFSQLDKKLLNYWSDTFLDKKDTSDFSTYVLSKSEKDLTSRLVFCRKSEIHLTSRLTQDEKWDVFHFSTKRKSRSQMYLFCQEKCVFNSLEVSYQVDKSKCRKPILSRKLTNCCREQQYIISQVEAL